jgi:5-methylcytosine-specific restriction enzyme subunit McrC
VSSPIPIQNIFYLLVYAWDKLSEGEVTDVSKLDSNELVDLFAHVLNSGIKHLLRRGLHQDYILHEEEIPGVRGRVNVGISARRMLLPHGRAFCEFDELSVDTLPNQILLSAVRRLLKSPRLDPALHFKLRGLNRELGGISEIRLTQHTFRKVQLHSNNRFYRFLLNICELALNVSMVDEESGEYRFKDFIRDERRMALLFESFVFNFLRTERPDLSIGRDHITWVAQSETDPQLAYLPIMKTDISVRSQRPPKTLIIDAKFYRETFQSYFDSETIHSGNLYQIYAYLKNLEIRGGADAQADGMLLYPVTDRSVRLTYELPGHRVHIRTLNLAADWKDIHNELMQLGVESGFGGLSQA